ncbi:protein phosphatase 2C domain-containing protein [Erysipelothrix enhydrae]|uniref:protein phosphatase 2C domain-containing protein n=1 Tax=Erysipelothrix enhydrae TaxID=2890314 RepID=UPI002B244CB4|nr:protein phosphatase 2C domain-containing protein [Erysipelothrix sp. 4322-04]WRB86990.1 protein phosphatase 2C domain-containing protein [Erysipelothrix sp. 4322-04]
MKYTSISEIGLIRKENQDYVVVVENDNALLAVVCDGIGGANAGSVASQMVVKLLRESFIDKREFSNLKDIRAWFDKAITSINRATYHESLVVREYSGMGTTLVAVVVLGEDVIGFNIGDSRIYSVKENQLSCLSHDQTYAYEMYKRNEISKEEIYNHPKRNILMNAVGIDENVDFEVVTITPKWDYLLLCSDGLHGYVPQDQIESTFKINGLLAQRNHLMEMAYKAGGYDNISIILLEADRHE